MTKAGLPPRGHLTPSPLSPSEALFDNVYVEEVFDRPDRDTKIAANERRLEAEAHPEDGTTQLQAELALEHLGNLRFERQRCYGEKKHADQLTLKQAGKRETPLCLHDHVIYGLAITLSLLGIFVGTWALAIYASESGVVAALDHSIWSALALTFPVVASSQALKAAGYLQKDDAAKRRYYWRLAMLAGLSFVVFLAGGVVAFAPHPTNIAEIQQQLTNGSPTQGFLTSAIDKVGPYLVVGGGLLCEMTAAAVIAHWADGLNAVGRRMIQGLAVTHCVLDAKIEELQPKIDEWARRAGTLQALVERREAALAARIDAALAYARQLDVEYAAFAADKRKRFLANRMNGRVH